LIRKWVILCVTLSLAIAVAGCCEALTNASNDYNAKQSAYDNMTAKLDQVNNLTVDFNKMGNDLESKDYGSDPSGYIPILNSDISKIDFFITAESDYKLSCQRYTAYLDTTSTEYSQIVNNENICDNNIKKAQDTKNKIGTIKEWINEFIAWNEIADKLQTQLNKSKYLSTGSDYHTWFQDTDPILNSYLTESNALNGETDMVISIVDPGTTRQELVQLKSTLQTGNDEIKVSYNQVVDYYNTYYESTYGIVLKV
jgi:hypothetical protein